MTVVPNIALNDGTTIPQLGLGVWQVPADTVQQVVTTAIETGYRHIDTAAAYGNEEGVGAAVAQSDVPREDLFITTKLRPTDFKAGKTHQALRDSLERLGLDYVDLYLIHWPAPADEQYVQAWKDLESLQTEGLTRSIGVSNFTGDHLDRIAEEWDTVPAINQIEVHPALQQRDIQAANQKYGIATQSWSPLAQGTVFEDEPVVAAAQAHGVSPAQVILRWHLQHGFIVFPRSVRAERIRSNFDLFGFELSDDQMQAIDGLERGGRTGGDPTTFQAGT